MKISVFGLGYVGVATSACFAAEGHDVIGVDVVQEKVDMLNAGISPIVEERIGDLIADCVKAGNLRATVSTVKAIRSSSLCIICVGTPSMSNGALDLSYVASVVEEIAEAVRDKKGSFTIVVRSTIVPGTMEGLVRLKLNELLGHRLDEEVKVLFHPEFLREGSSVYDFYHPPKIVVGEQNQGDAEALLSLYPDKFDAPRIVCPLKVAEMVKYCDNLYHALKVTFANEVGILAHALGIDSGEVMGIFCQDTKLNISSKYLRPGFAFGGSCLPKDLRAFLSVARDQDIRLPMLDSVLTSNRAQIQRVIDIILAQDFQRIGFYGLAFKSGTDDLRESPYVELAERLLGKGKDLVIYDEYVDLSRLTGTNKSVISERYPHLAISFTDDLKHLFTCEGVILCHPVVDGKVASLIAVSKSVFIDLAGTLKSDSISIV